MAEKITDSHFYDQDVPYQFKEYPKAIQLADGSTRTVQSRDEEDAAGVPGPVPGAGLVLSDLTVLEAEGVIADVEDLDRLAAFRESEEAGKGRIGVIRALDERQAALTAGE